MKKLLTTIITSALLMAGVNAFTQDSTTEHTRKLTNKELFTQSAYYNELTNGALNIDRELLGEVEEWAVKPGKGDIYTIFTSKLDWEGCYKEGGESEGGERIKQPTRRWYKAAEIPGLTRRSSETEFAINVNGIPNEFHTEESITNYVVIKEDMNLDGLNDLIIGVPSSEEKRTEEKTNSFTIYYLQQTQNTPMEKAPQFEEPVRIASLPRAEQGQFYILNISDSGYFPDIHIEHGQGYNYNISSDEILPRYLDQIKNERINDVAKQKPSLKK